MLSGMFWVNLVLSSKYVLGKVSFHSFLLLWSHKQLSFLFPLLTYFHILPPFIIVLSFSSVLSHMHIFLLQKSFPKKEKSFMPCQCQMLSYGLFAVATNHFCNGTMEMYSTFFVKTTFKFQNAFLGYTDLYMFM